MFVASGQYREMRVGNRTSRTKRAINQSSCARERVIKKGEEQEREEEEEDEAVSTY